MSWFAYSKGGSGLGQTGAEVGELSDLGVASQQAYAGLEGAIMNVRINIPSIKDEAFKTKTNSETTALLDEGRRLSDTIYKHVNDNIGRS